MSDDDKYRLTYEKHMAETGDFKPWAEMTPEAKALWCSIEDLGVDDIANHIDTIADRVGRRPHDPVAWECIDCGLKVFSFGADRRPEPALCGVCFWLREHIPDDAERARLRRHYRGG